MERHSALGGSSVGDGDLVHLNRIGSCCFSFSVSIVVYVLKKPGLEPLFLT